MATQFTYSVANDTLNGVISGARLDQEIRQSSITIALGGVTISGDNCIIDFKSDLSIAEETTLDGLLASHTGAVLPHNPDKVALFDSTGENPVPTDSDNSYILRNKTTKSGWHYEPRSLDFYTSKYKSLYNKKHDGNEIADGTDYGDAYLKFYDNAGAELSFQQTGHESETEAQFQARLDSNCVKTIMNWQPTYDMDIIGGILMVKDAPSTDAYLWTIAAPQLPEHLGGSVPFAAGGWNLSFFPDKAQLTINGRGAKTVIYDPVYNSNEFGLVIKHQAGVKIGIQMFYEHFKA